MSKGARRVSNDLSNAIYAYRDDQDRARGEWPSQRDLILNSSPDTMPAPPFPGRDNPMLRFLIEQADIALRAGDDPLTTVLQAAVHAWMEGHIEGYDRGRRDASAASGEPESRKDPRA